jgi:hypothetical protein
LNNKLTAKPTVKKIFESKKHPEKEAYKKSQVYNYGTFKNSNIFNAFLIDVLLTKKVN